MDIHTKQKIKLKLQEKHRTLCYEYKMPFLWKRHMLSMQQSNVGGVPWGQLMKLDFKCWKICFVFGTFM